MAFPAIGSTGTDPYYATLNAAFIPTHASGELLIALVTHEGTVTLTTSDDVNGVSWNKVGQYQANSNTHALFYLWTTSSDTTQVQTITFSHSIKAAFTAAITGADSSTAPEWNQASGSGTSANPPSLDPSGWGTEDTLWFAYSFFDGVDGLNNGYVSGPSGYTHIYDEDDAVPGGSGFSIGRDEVAAASEDPGTITLEQSMPWEAITVAIPPPLGQTRSMAATASSGSAATARLRDSRETTLAKWQFGDSVPDVTDSNVTVGNMTAAVGLDTYEDNGNYGYTTDPELRVVGEEYLNAATDVSGAASDAVTQGQYFSCTISSSKPLYITGFVFRAARGGSSAGRGFTLRTDQDSYATGIIEENVPTERTVWTNYDEPVWFDNISSIQVRWYVWRDGSNRSVEFDDIEVLGYTVGTTVTFAGSASSGSATSADVSRVREVVAQASSGSATAAALTVTGPITFAATASSGSAGAAAADVTRGMTAPAASGSATSALVSIAGQVSYQARLATGTAASMTLTVTKVLGTALASGTQMWTSLTTTQSVFTAAAASGSATWADLFSGEVLPGYWVQPIGDLANRVQIPYLLANPQQTWGINTTTQYLQGRTFPMSQAGMQITNEWRVRAVYGEGQRPQADALIAFLKSYLRSADPRMVLHFAAPVGGNWIDVTGIPYEISQQFNAGRSEVTFAFRQAP